MSAEGFFEIILANIRPISALILLLVPTNFTTREKSWEQHKHFNHYEFRPAIHVYRFNRNHHCLHLTHPIILKMQVMSNILSHVIGELARD